MTERRADQGLSVAPQRLGGDPRDPGSRRQRHRRRLGVAIVIAIAATIVTFAWLGPHLSSPPSLDLSFFATPTPATTPSGTTSIDPTTNGPLLPTSLPAITSDGTALSGTVAIETDALRVLDLGAGTISASAPALFGRDAVFRSPDGDGWTCVCFDDRLIAGVPNRVARVVEISAAGVRYDSTDIATFNASFLTDTGPAELTADVDISDGGHRGLLATASRRDNGWRFAIAPLDVDGRRLGSFLDLGIVTPNPAGSPAPSAPTPAAAPSLSAPDNVYVDGPHVRISPDGRVAFVWGIVQQSSQDAVVSTDVHAWRVGLGADGSIGEVGDAPGLDRLPSFCPAVGFAAADRMAWLCPSFSLEPTTDPPGSWRLGTVDLEGRSGGIADLPAVDQSSYAEPLFDRANGMVYAWDPNRLSILRIDAHSFGMDSLTFDSAAGSSTGLAPGGGANRPDWHDAESAIKQNGYRQVAGAGDGSRLYALGFDPQPAVDSGALGSRGVFVLDRSTLALVGRWAPAADYIALSPLPGGLVAAAGLPSVDAQGHNAPWEASLTIHDASDGRIVLRFGQLGSGGPPLVVDR